MTCVAAMSDGHAVTMGADAAGVDTGGSFTLERRARPKIFRAGRYLIGYTSSFRMGQLIEHAAILPEPHGDPDRFMVTEFVEAVRACLKAGGFSKKEHEVESGGTFLVAFDGLIFKIYDDYQVSREIAPFTACGCGEQVARGAMHALAARGATPREAVEAALGAAEACSAGVRGPFTILSTAPEGGDAG